MSSESAGGAGGVGGVGLAPRPAIDPVVLAVITAAVEELAESGHVVVVDEPVRSPAWRFSGRWWAKSVAVRRDRPWVRA